MKNHHTAPIYDRASNRTYRHDVVANAQAKLFDELYGYDEIQRLQDMARGTLDGGRSALTAESFAQCWTLDSTGNWKGFREDDTGNGTWDLVQARAANPVNEITSITNTTGPAWAQPAYNPTGNMTTIPQPNEPTQSYTATYDAWNRLVKLVDTTTTDTVSEYAYDGAKRRIVQQSFTSGVLAITRHYYYTEPSRWQILEERLGSSPDSADADRQFTWGQRYIDDLILRDRDTNSNGTLDERLYALQDANWNTIALANLNGDITERFAYSAYGVPLFLDASFIPQSSATSDWESLYCGYRYESATGFYHVRRRVLHSVVGSWVQRDPLKYIDGLAFYTYQGLVSTTDPMGTRKVGPFIGPYVPPGPLPPTGEYCSIINRLCRQCCTAVQIADGKKYCAETGRELSSCSYDRKYRWLNYTCKRTKEINCRCTIRHMPDPERKKFNCPDRVYGTGSRMADCQRNAKNTAPQQCRKYYGHCGVVS